MSFKDLKRDYLIQNAKKLFLNRSISEITIKDISVVSGIGEATIYRYFTNKETLATQVSLSIQKEILAYIKLDENAKGIERIEAFLNLFKKVFIEHREYYKFISEFDILYLQSLKDKNYSMGLDSFYDLFFDAYKRGLKDKSVKAINDLPLFYYTATHSLLELCKKLASVDSSLKQDKEVSKLAEITYLISLFVSVLKA